ncbi:uncharacterized protein LOC128677042 [Plodia interpunctella]|uniref:uncharacterized protein LOC128677042 n=1 Tax=Plodia interpunctella TaxID=58824 RepID=UPI00236755FD|nr:uncharacterized protein LOC128677042 [Plodia interpunctella]XP_053613563.1 uncharacterized protein LOC128677042 [Plodia interpunctella]XP_053613564.1 uncharacterized protein LOC128677042 [Plodia interpunctella]
MTLLLKSVWRSLLRNSPLNKSLASSSFVSSVSTETSRSKPPDAVMSSLKSAPSANDVLAAVQAHLPAMTHKHMLQALRSLFELHKSGKYHDEFETIMKNPAFKILCQNFKKYAPSLEVNEAIEATKVLSYLKVPVDSLIVQTMLQLIRCNINMISIRQIMFLDFVLNRFDTKNNLVDALKLALPLAFQIHLPLELDKDDVMLLKDMLAYCSTHDMPDRCINNVVTALLLHDQAINAQVAKSIIWSLCNVNCTEERFPTRVQLLHICYDILAQNIDQLIFDDILRTAAKLKGRVMEKHPEYYHEQLVDAIADYAVDQNVGFEKGLLLARVLSRIAHTHMGLVEYLCQLASSSPTALASARTNVLFSFVNCLSNNNYTPEPERWAALRRQISNNPVLDARNAALPWTKICLELASLGHYEDKLLSRVFSEDFLKEYLSRENNTLDYLQLLTLYEAVKAFHSDQFSLPQDVIDTAKSLYPVHAYTDLLEEHLSRGLGSQDYVVKNVVLPNGFVADLLMCLKNNYPIQLHRTTKEVKVPLEALNLPQGGVTVCVMNFNQGCFSMNSNRLRGTFRLVLDILEKLGCVAVPVNSSEWLSAPAHERTPYLLREVGYKCGEFGMKLCAT